MINPLYISAEMPVFISVGIVIIVLGLTAAVLSTVFLKPKLVIRRAFKKSVPKPFYSVKEGEYVRLHGRVKPAEKMLKAPLSKRDCFAFSIEVSTVKNNGETSVAKDFKAQSFSIEDAEHVAEIQIKHSNAVTCHLEADLKMTSEAIKVKRSNYRSFLKRYNIQETEGLFDQRKKRLNIKERSLRPGEMVAVKGVASWTTEQNTGKRKLIIKATPSKKLLVTDDPKVIRTMVNTQ